MFFSKFVILVEGYEDVGYVRGAIGAYGYEEEFLSYGYNIIPVMGKEEMVPVIELCKAFRIPYFVVFDADSNNQNGDKKSQIEKTNKTLYAQLSALHIPAFPESIILKITTVSGLRTSGIV